MQYTTKKDKEELTQVLNRYIQAGHKLSILRYKRLTMWLNHVTYAEIAQEEGVKPQAIQQSVGRDVKLLKSFAKDNHYGNISEKEG